MDADRRNNRMILISYTFCLFSATIGTVFWFVSGDIISKLVGTMLFAGMFTGWYLQVKKVFPNEEIDTCTG